MQKGALHSGKVWFSLGGRPALRTEEQRGSENQHCAFSNILKGRREERAKPLAEGEKATRETLSLGTWLEQSLDVIAKKAPAESATWWPETLWKTTLPGSSKEVSQVHTVKVSQQNGSSCQGRSSSEAPCRSQQRRKLMRAGICRELELRVHLLWGTWRQPVQGQSQHLQHNQGRRDQHTWPNLHRATRA